ncbi:MAG: hypothetical protein CMP07_08485 [Xanthomonadales bacterium]|nr:hypothetical protein [Xanthomonadales bacterium]
MSTSANALNRPNPLLQTVARADFQTHAPLDRDSGSSGMQDASAPGFRMVCQAICRVAGHGGPAWVEMLVRGTGKAASLSPMDIVRRGYDHSGLDFDLKVLDAALAAAAALHPETRIGVNIRPCSLNEPGFIRALHAMLVRRRIAPGRLVLELVEFHGPVRLEMARHALRRLRRMQVMIALDDFGPGHPNLDVLAEGLVDFVKLDRSLVRALDESPRQSGVLQGIVALAAGTGTTLVAEGIETPAQLDALRRLGIEWMQGFLFGRPDALTRRPSTGGDASDSRPRTAGSAAFGKPQPPLTAKECKA